jgi:hypothetical protein
MLKAFAEQQGTLVVPNRNEMLVLMHLNHANGAVIIDRVRKKVHTDYNWINLYLQMNSLYSLSISIH